MKNYEIRGKSAFYDSVANETPLCNASQARKWLEEINKEHGVETLYIKTVNNSYYKHSVNCEIKAITMNEFQSEWESCKQNFALQDKAANNNGAGNILQGTNERENIKQMIVDEIEAIVAKIKLKIEK